MRALLVSMLFLASASTALKAEKLPCSKNPGPNCYNDLRPSEKLAACEHTKDEAKLKCYQKSSSSEQRGCIEVVNTQHASCVTNATH